MIKAQAVLRTLKANQIIKGPKLPNRFLVMSRLQTASDKLWGRPESIDTPRNARNRLIPGDWKTNINGFCVRR